MTSHKREDFLSFFFSAFGASKVKWTNIYANYVAGTIFFSESGAGEPQNFQWEMTEREAPDENTLSLMEFLDAENLLNSGRLTKPADEIEVPKLNKRQKAEAFGELFDVRIQILSGRKLALKTALSETEEHI